MKTIHIETYQFNELNDSAKERARNWFRKSIGDDSCWSECVLDEVEEQGRLLGIDFATRSVPLVGGGTREHAKIYFAGFNCQGDGACFVGTWRARDVKADKVADGWGDATETAELKRIAKGFAAIAKRFPCSSFTTTHRGHYYHENSVAFDLDSGADDCSGSQLDSYRTAEDDSEEPDGAPRDRMAEDFPEDDLKELARDFMLWIYKRLESTWNAEHSDESVDENIRANEYEFTESGERSVSL